MSKPIHIFADAIDGAALSQFYDAMKCDFALKGALMPDAHKGYALPIGAVPLRGEDLNTASRVREAAEFIFKRIYEVVPTGFRHNDRRVVWAEGEKIPCTKVVSQQITDGALKQLGSLGSGNHFIEIGVDDFRQVWIIIHSGSRNVGHKTATHYMKLASGDGKAREAHFGLRVDSPEGQDYITDLNFCLEFALANRREIANRVAGVIREFTGAVPDWDRLVNRNHNHAELRWMAHNGPTRDMKAVWVHRKGATHAEDGMMGVIPGNMRDGSFIVRGKGNPDSLWSSSHGAGRVLGRREANETLSLEDFVETMTGVVAKVNTSTLDESPFAYKDIFAVMAAQTDLVEVVAHVRPIINIKG
ncbi:RtcB family protein [Magnetospirillum molischianum]|uniref:3'-phosphate/5'-hydroxy nucleic acid ligase n=1 Tax=Magnetospirillum molischianum DSM 120 TaxID=1150626 RepID=H8FYD5_MAGML|nr:RtcB family protein [Magnetospirillum molischianum]CCG43373.1 conserved hypothetical protein [Magnetospirillum molischianum DSM 120]